MLISGELLHYYNGAHAATPILRAHAATAALFLGTCGNPGTILVHMRHPRHYSRAHAATHIYEFALSPSHLVEEGCRLVVLCGATPFTMLWAVPSASQAPGGKKATIHYRVPPKPM